jgi:hypothetical protein
LCITFCINIYTNLITLWFINFFFNFKPFITTTISEPEPQPHSSVTFTMATSSQATSSSDPFVRPSSPDSCSHTSLFSRIGRDQGFFLWTGEYHEQFLEWWLNTTWALRTIALDNDDLAKRLNWDSHTRKSIAWGSFDQAANRVNGSPVVICRQCGGSLIHPNVKATGTKALSNHISSMQCRKASIGKGGPKQPLINEALLASSVSWISIRISIKS